MKITRAILICITVILAIAAAFWIKEQLDIDRCLDSGGRWDYEQSMCFRTPEDSPS